VTRIDVALFNYQDGGRAADGTYDFFGLQRAFADVEAAPALILFCEAKNYRDHAGQAKYAAAEALSDELGMPYVAEIGSMARAPMPPAVFYNPAILVLRRWWNQDDPGVYEDQRNLAWFAIRDSARVAGDRSEFLAWVQHWEPLSGDARLEAARRISRTGKRTLPVIGGGDLNATASGAHLPQRDWMTAPFASRSHKGMLGPDGQWGPDTARSTTSSAPGTNGPGSGGTDAACTPSPRWRGGRTPPSRSCPASTRASMPAAHC
jgi:hypothetical protein